MKSYTPKAKPYSNFSKTVCLITWEEKVQYTGKCYLTKNLEGKYFASRYWESKDFKRRRDAVKFASKLIREYYDTIKPCTYYK